MILFLLYDYITSDIFTLSIWNLTMERVSKSKSNDITCLRSVLYFIYSCFVQFLGQINEYTNVIKHIYHGFTKKNDKRTIKQVHSTWKMSELKLALGSNEALKKSHFGFGIWLLLFRRMNFCLHSTIGATVFCWRFFAGPFSSTFDMASNVR